MMPQTYLLTHIKVLTQIQLNYLSELKSNKPSFFTGAFKSFTNTFLSKLIEIESKYFDKAIDKQEEATKIIYDVSDEFYKCVSSIPVMDMQNFVSIYNAYYKDKKSIEGICKKILK